MKRALALVVCALTGLASAQDRAASGVAAEEFCTRDPNVSQACFKPPGDGWLWKSSALDAYTAVPPGSAVAFRVEFLPVKFYTIGNVSAQLGRHFRGVPDDSPSLMVTPSSVLVADAYRFTFAPILKHRKTVGYVTPSGWMIFGEFDDGHEPGEFTRFVRSYREKRMERSVREVQASDEPPVSHSDLRGLFEFLSAESGKGRECDHDFTLTRKFLAGRTPRVEAMIDWLRKNGAGCDCEVMFNVEQDWGERVGYEPQE